MTNRLIIPDVTDYMETVDEILFRTGEHVTDENGQYEIPTFTRAACEIRAQIAAHIEGKYPSLLEAPQLRFFFDRHYDDYYEKLGRLFDSLCKELPYTPN